ncbi:XRE family transcriptional regulator [Bacillus thuringiensis]
MQNKLISFRMYNGLTQQDMANLIGVDKRTYINKEQGITQFKANEMFLIAQNVGKKIEEIFLPTNFIEYEVLDRDVVMENKTYSIG